MPRNTSVLTEIPRLACSIPEGASAIGVSRSLIYKELAEGRGPETMVIAGRRVVTLDALHRYCQKLEEAETKRLQSSLGRRQAEDGHKDDDDQEDDHDQA